MGRGYQGAVLHLLRAPEFELEVAEVEDRGTFTRVRVHCAQLLGPGAARELPPTVWVRLWVPGSGDKEFQRAYTLVEVDPDSARASIYVLHHEPSGPASRWARNAAAGSRVKAQLYGGKKYTPPLPGQRLLLIGDPASAPAIGDALDRAPASCDVEVVLLAGADAWVPLGEHRATLTRVPVSAGDEALMRHLRETLARGVPDWAWVALESTPTRTARRALMDAGVPKSAIQSQAYWIRGRSMGAAE